MSTTSPQEPGNAPQQQGQTPTTPQQTAGTQPAPVIRDWAAI